MSEITVRPLDETVALVVGGTSGIGLESAIHLAQAGVPAIALCGRDAARGQAALSGIGARVPGCDARFIAADAATPEGAEGLARQAVEAFGRVDLLLCSAGANNLPRLFHEMSHEQISKVVAQDLMGTFHCARAVLPHMMRQKGGTIVTIASDAAKVATPGETVIGAVMAAIVMFSRALAIEAKRSGVRVNCLTPSIVAGTPFHDRLMDDPFTGRLFGRAKELAHLGVVGPRDIAPLVVFLASPAAARLTGQAISVNGGISAA